MNRTTVVAVLAALLTTTSMAACASRAPAEGARAVGAERAIGAERVIGGLDMPVAFTFGPGNRIWYVGKATGEVRVRDLDTGRDRRFFDVPGVNSEGERGLLGIALHPDFPDQPYVYVYATRSASGQLRNQILRIEDAGGSGRATKVILNAPASSSPYHNGGRILFGPDGMLYAVVGDGHDAANAQDLSRNVRGKVLRTTPAGGAPATNPFHASRVFAYGIRNSFGMAFDPVTGRLWETENGPACNDELNLIRAGDNYGWGPSESCDGKAPRNTNRDGPRPVLPIRWYTPTIAPTGIAFCDGCALGTTSEGAFFFGAYNTGDVRRVTLNDTRSGIDAQQVVYTHPRAVLAIEAGPDGALYLSDADAIYRLVRA